MDVIINNPATSALPQIQYAPVTQTPYGYPGYDDHPGYDGYQDHHFHGGPGLVLPLLLLGGLLFLRGRGKRRRQMMRRAQMQGGQMGGNPMPGAGPAPAGPFSSDMPGSFGDRSFGGPGNFMDDIRENFRRGRQQFVTSGALDIARERYARGEISAEEYQTILKTLSAQPGGNQAGSNQPPPTIV